jgi:phosphinothricin acetyltransferase
MPAARRATVMPHARRPRRLGEAEVEVERVMIPGGDAAASEARVIRLAREADAEAVRAIYAPIVRDTAISFELEPPSADEMRGRIAATLVRFPWLVHERDGAVDGYVYASAHRSRAAYQWSVDTTVYVHEAARRGGVGRALYAVLLALLRLQGFTRAYAGITLPNAGSVGLHEAIGFRALTVYRGVGFKLGRWHDVGWWEHDLQPLAPDPAPPRPLPVIADSAELARTLAAARA